nr:MAG TPA: hypothetical protein [Bacteriophage sp.]
MSYFIFIVFILSIKPFSRILSLQFINELIKRVILIKIIQLS